MVGENQVEQLKDFSYRGIVPNYNTILTGVDALKNVIKMYLMSEAGDYGRNINKGGPLVILLGKAMAEGDVDRVKKTVEDALSIYSNIILHKIDVVRELETRNWRITILFSDTYNKFTDSTNLVIRGWVNEEV